MKVREVFIYFFLCAILSLEGWQLWKLTDLGEQFARLDQKVEDYIQQSGIANR